MTARRKPAASRAKFLLLHKIVADPELSMPAKVVAISLLLKFQNTKTGQCNPRIADVCEATARSRRAVFYDIDELKSRGWLTVTGAGGGSPSTTNHYRFHDRRVQDSAPVRGAKDDTPTGATEDTGARFGSDGCNYLHTNQEEPLSPSERECVGSAIERAPDGALAEGFELLCQTWRKPDGVNRKAAWQAYQVVCDDHDGDDVQASAERWVASTPARYLKKLEVWLGNGAWLNEPAQRQGGGARGAKLNPVDEMLNAGGVRRHG